MIEIAYACQDAPRRIDTGGIRNRMPRFDDLDPATVDCMAVARDDDARQRRGPAFLERARHRRRALAGADDDRAAGRQIGQVRRQRMRGLRRFDGRVEHAPQQDARVEPQCHGIDRVAAFVSSGETCSAAACARGESPCVFAPASHFGEGPKRATR